MAGRPSFLGMRAVFRGRRAFSPRGVREADLHETAFCLSLHSCMSGVAWVYPQPGGYVL